MRAPNADPVDVVDDEPGVFAFELYPWDGGGPPDDRGLVLESGGDVATPGELIEPSPSVIKVCRNDGRIGLMLV